MLSVKLSADKTVKLNHMAGQCKGVWSAKGGGLNEDISSELRSISQGFHCRGQDLVFSLVSGQPGAPSLMGNSQAGD